MEKQYTNRNRNNKEIIVKRIEYKHYKKYLQETITLILYIDKHSYKIAAGHTKNILEHNLTKGTTLHLINYKQHLAGYMLTYPKQKTYYLASLAILPKYPLS